MQMYDIEHKNDLLNQGAILYIFFTWVASILNKSRKEAQAIYMTICSHTWLGLPNENEGIKGNTEALEHIFTLMNIF